MRYLVLVLIGLSAQAAPVTPVIADLHFQRDYDQADSFIREILSEHEQAFPGVFCHHRILYYKSLASLSRIQRNVLTEMRQMPSYKRDLAAHGPMIDLSVEVTAGEAKAQVTSFREGLWRRLKLNMTDRLPDEKNADQVVAKLRNIVSQAVNDGGNWSDGYRRMLKIRDAMVRYVLAASVRSNLPVDATKGQLKTALLDMDIGGLDYLADKKNYQKYFFPETGSRIDNLNESDVDFDLSRSHQLIVERLYDDRAPVQLIVGDHITMREVHPNFAIFRGYVGNDCSTSYSPGFVFTPFDRYYYVFDRENRPLGYVGLSIVEIDSKRAIFLHTIQGPKFSTAQTQMVMMGVQKAAAAWGAERVVLANDSSIHANINFFQIERTMKEAVADKPFISVHWFDRDYRKLIVRHDSTLTYDDPDRNHEGRQLTLEVNRVNVEVTERPFVANFTPCEQSLLGNGKS